MNPSAWGQALAISSSCNGRGKGFGYADLRTAPLEWLCFSTPAAPKLHHENSWRHEPGSSSRVPIPPLSPGWTLFHPDLLSVALARQRVLGNTTGSWEQSGWANLHGGLEKGFLLLHYQVSQSSGTPSKAQPGPVTELSCNLPCPPPHSPSLPQPLSGFPSRIQGSVLTSIKSHSWIKSVLMYLSLSLPSRPPSSDLSPCLCCQSYDRASRWSAVDPPFPVYSKCSIKTS